MKIISLLLLVDALALFGGPSLGYVLQASKGTGRAAFVKAINGSGREIVVIDHSFDGDRNAMWRKQELAAMKAGAPKRKIIAYLSIGEAEDYRFYWKKKWNGPGRPSFLLAENPEWKGNFRVRYWDREWQAIVLEYLDTIMRQGFDGVYLDIVDGYENFEKGRDKCPNPETRRSYREDMKQLVRLIALRARGSSPNFIVIQQNAQALLEDASYMELLDGICAEDVFTDGKRPQNRKEALESVARLKKAQEKGLLAVLVEYPKTQQLRDYARKSASKHGLDLLITDRKLTGLGIFTENAKGMNNAGHNQNLTH